MVAYVVPDALRQAVNVQPGDRRAYFTARPHDRHAPVPKFTAVECEVVSVDGDTLTVFFLHSVPATYTLASLNPDVDARLSVSPSVDTRVPSHAVGCLWSEWQEHLDNQRREGAKRHLRALMADAHDAMEAHDLEPRDGLPTVTVDVHSLLVACKRADNFLGHSCVAFFDELEQLRALACHYEEVIEAEAVAQADRAAAMMRGVA